MDVDASYWLLVEDFEPTFPSLFSQTVDLGPCDLDVNLCFTSFDLRPNLGDCAP